MKDDTLNFDKAKEDEEANLKAMGKRELLEEMRRDAEVALSELQQEYHYLNGRIQEKEQMIRVIDAHIRLLKRDFA